MKGIYSLLLITWLLIPFFSVAQYPEERIHIQTDREYYAKGETIHFKAFIVTGDSVTESSNVFVELWDTAFRKIAEICLPVIDATSCGSVGIPGDTRSNPVFLRAYTDVTGMQGVPFQFVKPVYSKDPGIATETVSAPVFFPEGGRLVYNAVNYVTFKSPENFKGSIRNNRGERVTDAEPNQYGLGVFSFRPVPGERYFCHWRSNERDMVTALPVPFENGIALHVSQSEDTLFFDLDNGGNKNLRILNPKVQLLINNEVAYVVVLNMTSKERFSYFIPLVEFGPGMAEVRVLDSEEQVLAIRPVFIARKMITSHVELDTVKKDFSKRGENIIRLDLHDTLLKYMSVSITDASFDNRPGDRTGLLSAFLPASLSSIPPVNAEGRFNGMLDLAVQTTSGIQKRGDVENTTVRATPERQLKLSGVVKRGKKPYANKEVLVGARSPYTGKELYKVFTDDQGRFELDGVIFYGETFVHCRRPGNADDELSADFFLRRPSPNTNIAFFEEFKQLAVASLQSYRRPEAGAETIPGEMLWKDTLISADSAIVLEEVVVHADNSLLARRRLEELEKKYIDGTGFSGYFATGETLDVMNDPRAPKYFDLFSYIGQNMRGITLTFRNGRKELLTFGRGIVTVFYLKNLRIDRDMADNIRPDEVALVKFVPMLATEKGFPPAIAIYLKKPGDEGYWEKDRYQLREQTVTGYTVPRDFRVQDYSQNERKVVLDARKTLLWQPYTVVDRGVAEIKFYNNDHAKKIRIRAEGISSDGNIVYFESVLE